MFSGSRHMFFREGAKIALLIEKVAALVKFTILWTVVPKYGIQKNSSQLTFRNVDLLAPHAVSKICNWQDCFVDNI